MIDPSDIHRPPKLGQKNPKAARGLRARGSRTNVEFQGCMLCLMQDSSCFQNSRIKEQPHIVKLAEKLRLYVENAAVTEKR